MLILSSNDSSEGTSRLHHGHMPGVEASAGRRSDEENYNQQPSFSRNAKQDYSACILHYEQSYPFDLVPIAIGTW
jgi:hypothetical protein